MDHKIISDTTCFSNKVSKHPFFNVAHTETSVEAEMEQLRGGRDRDIPHRHSVQQRETFKPHPEPQVQRVLTVENSEGKAP